MNGQAARPGSRISTLVLAFCFPAVWLSLGSTDLQYAIKEDFLGIYTGAR